MKRFQTITLILAILATGFCGMIAEYSVSTMVGYLIGSTITAFTWIIAVFMLAMGAAALFSKRIEGDELTTFFFIELLLSVVCATSTVIISQATQMGFEWETSLAIAAAIGGLIGCEIPLLMRINEKRDLVLAKNVSLVFGLDYIGSFIAGVTFSSYLLPLMGPVNTAILGGAVNLLIACALCVAFAGGLRLSRVIPASVVAIAVVVSMGMWGERIVFEREQALYDDPIVYVEQTPYQKIVITEDRGGDHCMYLNGNTQFCLSDEHRYHEMLVHPSFVLRPDARRVLVLGGGDGLAIREVLKHTDVEHVQLVDLDPAMVKLASTFPHLVRANGGSFADDRVVVAHADAFVWVHDLAADTSAEKYDIIIVDLPDPSCPEIAKMYSLEFYRALKGILRGAGVVVTQSTSPIHARDAFIAINKTLEAAGYSVVPYRVNVPSFGDWGFNIAQRDAYASPDEMRSKLDGLSLSVSTRFLNADAMVAATRWEKGVWDRKPLLKVSRVARPTVQLAYEDSEDDWE